MVSRKFAEALGLTGTKNLHTTTTATVNALKQESVFVKNDNDKEDELVDF